MIGSRLMETGDRQTKKNIRVFLVDDHEVAREGLRRMLELEQDVEVVGEAAGAEEALDKLESISPDVILMDIKMPTINGLEATRMLKERGVAAAIIIVSLHAEYLAEALEAGAGGYLVKDLKRAELVSAIRRVTQGELVLGGSLLNSPEITQNALSYLRNALHGAAQADSNNDHFSAGERAEREDAKAVPPRQREDEGGTGAAGSYEVTRPDALRHTGLGVHPGGPEPGLFDGGAVKDASEWLVTGQNGDAPADQSQVGPESFPSGATLYESDVELVVEPPIDAGVLLRLCKWLRSTAKAEIEESTGSWDGGTTLKILIRRPVPLLDMLEGLPDVASVWEEPLEGQPESRRFLKRKRSEQHSERGPTKRLRLVLQEGQAPKQLSLPLDSPASS